jgi:hypothetical protein
VTVEDATSSVVKKSGACDGNERLPNHFHDAHPPPCVELLPRHQIVLYSNSSERKGRELYDHGHDPAQRDVAYDRAVGAFDARNGKLIAQTPVRTGPTAVAVGDDAIWVAISVVPLSRPEGGAVVSRTDVTERKRAEMQAELFENPSYAPLGLFYQPTTFRSNLKDIPEGIPQFYRVRRTA